MTNACTWEVIALTLGPGGCTSTVTGPVVAVSALSSRVTPGIALVSLFVAEIPATPSIVYSAFTPSFARPACSTSVPPGSETAMKPAPVAPVSRVESTTVSLPTAAAYTVAVESELIVLTRSSMVASAATSISLPSIVSFSAAAGLLKVNVRCPEFASWVTLTS